MAKRDPEAEVTPGLSRLPPGRHGLPRAFVAENQRNRITAGIIAAVSEFGYQEATITHIAAAAGVSRRTFYGYFNSKEECYLATFDQIAEHICDAARRAAASPGDWPAKVAARIGAALEVYSTNPQLAVFTLAVPPRTGNEVTAHYRAALDRALEQLLEGVAEQPSVEMPTETVRRSLLGGVVALIVQSLESGDGQRIRKLQPELVELFLTPFVGRAEAALAAAESL